MKFMQAKLRLEAESGSSSGECAALEAEIRAELTRQKQMRQKKREKAERKPAAPKLHHTQDQRSIASYVHDILQRDKKLNAFGDEHYEKAE